MAVGFGGPADGGGAGAVDHTERADRGAGLFGVHLRAGTDGDVAQPGDVRIAAGARKGTLAEGNGRVAEGHGVLAVCRGAQATGVGLRTHGSGCVGHCVAVGACGQGHLAGHGGNVAAVACTRGTQIVAADRGDAVVGLRAGRGDGGAAAEQLLEGGAVDRAGRALGVAQRADAGLARKRHLLRVHGRCQDGQTAGHEGGPYAHAGGAPVAGRMVLAARTGQFRGHHHRLTGMAPDPAENLVHLGSLHPGSQLRKQSDAVRPERPFPAVAAASRAVGCVWPVPGRVQPRAPPVEHHGRANLRRLQNGCHARPLTGNSRTSHRRGTLRWHGAVGRAPRRTGAKQTGMGNHQGDDRPDVDFAQELAARRAHRR